MLLAPPPRPGPSRLPSRQAKGGRGTTKKTKHTKGTKNGKKQKRFDSVLLFFAPFVCFVPLMSRISNSRTDFQPATPTAGNMGRACGRSPQTPLAGPHTPKKEADSHLARGSVLPLFWRVWAGEGGAGESAFGGPGPPRAATVCETFRMPSVGGASHFPLAIRRRRTTDSFGCGREPRPRRVLRGFPISCPLRVEAWHPAR